jgi:hypothetical protein
MKLVLGINVAVEMVQRVLLVAFSGNNNLVSFEETVSFVTG